MLIQAIGAFTIETPGQKQPLALADGEFADLPGGAANDAIQQGTARAATYEEYAATLAPAQVNQQSSAAEEGANVAPRRRNRSTPATEG